MLSNVTARPQRSQRPPESAAVMAMMPVTELGTYDLSVDGEVLVLKGAKPLPARD